MSQKCHYCENEATQFVVWLKDKYGDPARIQLPWCGCDLMTALRKFWPSPYPVREGVDYEVEARKSDLTNKLEALSHCAQHVEAGNNEMASYEDVMGHLFDLIGHFNKENLSIEELDKRYGKTDYSNSLLPPRIKL